MYVDDCSHYYMIHDVVSWVCTTIMNFWVVVEVDGVAVYGLVLPYNLWVGAGSLSKLFV